jgi:galactose mutarotase-like enzyme
MASVSTGTVEGWRSLVLEDETLQVTVLPDKGADVYSLVDLRTGVDVLFKAPWGLRPPGSPPLEGSGDDEFLWNYEGGWQELLPSVNEACTYRGRRIPFHGEVATLTWEHEVMDDADGIQLWTRCRQTPFRLERTMRLRAGTLEVAGTVVNDSDVSAHFVWGHHVVVGPPFLGAGCRIEAAARTIVTAPELWEPETARIEPRQRAAWPHAPIRAGGTVDLRAVPGPEAASHDDLYLTDLTGGELSVTNPRLGLRFELEWDPAVFRYVVLWQPYGGARAQPLAGSYALGVEPWTSRFNLEQALEAGEAIELGGGERFESTVRARVRAA